MELKINIDTQAVATQMVACMMQNLHNSVVTFAHQKFGALNPQAGPFPFPTHLSGMFPGAWPSPLGVGFGQPQLGGFQQPQMFGLGQGLELNPHFAPGRPFAAPQSAWMRAQEPGGNSKYEKQPSEYGKLMDALATNPELVSKVEEILKTHLQEFVNVSLPTASAEPQI